MIGKVIGSSQRFVSQGNGGVLMGEAIYSPGGGQYRGKWIHVMNRFLGLKFQINGETHFGWVRMTVKLLLSRPMQVLLSGYAYETQPSTPIVAGQTQDQDGASPAEPRVEEAPGADAFLDNAPVPKPASLGVLALGASGLPLWRREKIAPSSTVPAP